MTRKIYGLNLSVWRSIRELLPRAAEFTNVDQKNQLIDIELNPAAILKAYDNEIIIDMGGEKAIIQDNDFEYIAMR